ncbi:MAG TPA: glycosyl hydrolase [Thermoleophilaceae bacterium]
MKRPPPVAVVLAALALFGVGIGVLVAAQPGGGRPAPAVAVPSAVLKPGRLPSSFFGVVSEDAFANPGRYRATTLNRLAQIGVGLVRQTFDWASIERSPGHYDFGAYDGIVGSLAARHMTVLPVLLNPPGFRSSAPPTGAQPGTYPPKSYADMGRFAAALVRRYGPRGHFWNAHPELPKIPIRAWQIWNEPSLPAYWPSGPDPAEYTQLLERVGRSIRHLDPRAEIVTAGIPNSRLGIPFDQFVEGMYRAGARGSFDALAIHPYARDAAGVGAAVNDARRIMDTNGDTRSHIWITELGWADGGPSSSFTVGAQGQARRVKAALTTLYNLRSQDRINGVVYFGWRDGAPYAPTFKDFWGLHTGLLRLDGTPKPALRAFAQTVASLRRSG